MITLAIQYDYGPLLIFTGTLTDTNQLMGTLSNKSGTVAFAPHCLKRSR
jgi:hypothetical protein